MKARYPRILAHTTTTLFATMSLVVAAQPQNALDFDGADDQVVVAGASTHIANSSEISLTAWVYPRNAVSAFPDLDGYAGFRNDADADFYLVQIYNDVIEGRFRNSDGTAFTATTSAGISLNTWHHIGLVYDGAALTIWLDGDAVATTAASGTITNTSAPFSIGNINYTTQPFFLDGRMDEVALWRRALSAEEMECLSALPPNSGDPDIVLFYNCDQGTAGGDNTTITTLTDLTGNADGTLQGLSLTGATSNFVAGTVFGTQVNASICPGGTYSFNGQTLTGPGVYTASIPTGGLCDSTVVLTLTETTVNVGVVQSGNILIAQAGGAAFQWIRCETGLPISGASNQYYTAFAVGEYAVVVTQNGCSDTSACYNVTTIGMEELVLPTLRVWPQPATDRLNVEVSTPLQQADLRITDMTGRVVLRRNLPFVQRTSVDVTELTTGVYFLELNAQGKRVVERFVRE